MPRFDYKCRICAQVFELIAPANVEVVRCPSCNQGDYDGGGTPVLADRQLSTPAHFHIH